MSYDERLDRAKSILDNFNNNVEESQKINIEEFEKSLKGSGGVSEEMLAMCTWEDIEDCGERKSGATRSSIPRLIAKKIALIFREKKKVESNFVNERKAASLTTRELLERFEPRSKEEGPVAKRLKALSGGEPCLVFNRDGALNINASLKCIEDILDDYSALSEVIVDGVPHTTYIVGERPASRVSENPLFPGEALRGSDEMCDRTTRSWKEVPQELRVLLRLALKTKELVIDQYGKVHDIFDKLSGTTDSNPARQLHVLTSFVQRFPKAKLLYNDLEDDGKLPSLRIKRGSKKSKKQDPFFGGSKNKTY